MKRLSTTIISDAKRFPFKKGTLEFLQDAYKEIVSRLLEGAIGASFNGINVYPIFGCVNSGSGLNYNISAGAIFYLGEIYDIDAAAFTASAGQVAVLNFVTTQFTTNADPVTFTDATVNSVHDIRKVVIQAGASGSGFKDFSDITPYDFTTSKTISSEFVKGYMRFATLSEVNAGVDNDSAITPLKLKTTFEVMHTDNAFRMRSKTIEIGDWNMDADRTLTIAHGISDFTTIRPPISCIVRNDANDFLFNLEQPNNTSGVINGGIQSIGPANIILNRLDSGVFDDSGFDSTGGYNRGWVTINYQG